MKRIIVFLMMISIASFGASNLKESKEVNFKQISQLETKLLNKKIEMNSLKSKLEDLKAKNLILAQNLSVLRSNDETIKDEFFNLKGNLENIKKYYLIKSYIKRSKNQK